MHTLSTTNYTFFLQFYNNYRLSIQLCKFDMYIKQ